MISRNTIYDTQVDSHAAIMQFSLSQVDLSGIGVKVKYFHTKQKFYVPPYDRHKPAREHKLEAGLTMSKASLTYETREAEFLSLHMI